MSIIMRILTVFLIFLLTIIQIQGCSSSSQEKNPAPSKEQAAPEEVSFEVGITRAIVGKIKPILNFTGNIRSSDEVRVSSRIAGKIESIYVKEGDAVKKGMMLVKLDQTDFILSKNDAQSRLDLAKVRLSELMSGSRPQEIKQAEAQLEHAKANRINAANNLRRIERLHSLGAIPAKDYDAAKAQYDIAEAQVKSAEEFLDMMKIGPRQEQIDAARAVVRQAQIALDIAETQLSYTMIPSPIDGVVLTKYVNPTEVINPGIPLLLLSDTSKVKFEIDISENKIKDVFSGQKMKIEADGYPGRKFDGKILKIEPLVDQVSRTFKAQVEILNPDNALRVGMFARAFVEGKEKKSIILPRKAVLDSDGGSKVMVVRDGRALSKRVTPGMQEGDFIEIEAGITEGEDVIVEGNYGLQDGAKVKVAKKSDMKR